MAIAALILGIVSLVFCWFPYTTIFTGIAGIILGALGKKDPAKSGMATAGLVMSIIGLALCLILWIACAACIGCASTATTW